MKKLILFFTLFIFCTQTHAGSNVGADCTYKGIKLFGKVAVVDSFPDIKVKVVSNFADLKVKAVENFADECGEWTFVKSFPDFKIQYVESFPDITIELVENFPGVN